MPQYQLVGASINLGGKRDHVTVRGIDQPLTYPEVLVLRTLHGGNEHVHSEVDLGLTEDRTPEDEFRRLTEIYGRVVADVFPPVGGSVMLPTGDAAIPTADEVAAADAAAEAARAEARAKRSGTKSGSKTKAAAKAEPAPPADADAVPDLSDLPS